MTTPAQHIAEDRVGSLPGDTDDNSGLRTKLRASPGC